jgi:hypothetical protein
MMEPAGRPTLACCVEPPDRFVILLRAHRRGVEIQGDCHYSCRLLRYKAACGAIGRTGRCRFLPARTGPGRVASMHGGRRHPGSIHRGRAGWPLRLAGGRRSRSRAEERRLPVACRRFDPPVAEWWSRPSPPPAPGNPRPAEPRASALLPASELKALGGRRWIRLPPVSPPRDPGQQLPGRPNRPTVRLCSRRPTTLSGGSPQWPGPGIDPLMEDALDRPGRHRTLK